MEALRPPLFGDDVTLRVLELSDAAAWLEGEDEEQLRWFELRAATLDDVHHAMERWRASWAQGGPVRHWGIWAVGGALLAGGVQRPNRAPGARLNLPVVGLHRRFDRLRTHRLLTATAGHHFQVSASLCRTVAA